MNLPIDEKIRAARELFEQWESRLRVHPDLCLGLAELLSKIDASRRAMRDRGVAQACAHCDREEGGSCCGAGIEDRYSPTMLLVNLLLGADLPAQRRIAGSCFFLAPLGCTLPAREIICINYLCTRLQKSIPAEDLHALQQVTGEEMEAIFAFHEALKKVLRQAPPAP